MDRLSDFGFLDLATARKLDLIKGALSSEKEARSIAYLVAGDEDLSIREQYSSRKSTSIGHRCNRGYRRRKRGTRAFESSYANHLTIRYPMYKHRPSQAFSTITHLQLPIPRRCRLFCMASQLINQTQLPPQTTRIGRGVHYLPNACSIKVENLAVVTIQGEMGKLRTSWSAILGERGNVLLQGHRRCIGFDHGIICWEIRAKEGIGYVLPVERRWYAKLVGISLVTICTV